MTSRISHPGLIIRKATEQDYQAAVEIQKDVYDKLDYLPDLYFTFFHRNKHVAFIIEEERVAVSFAILEISPDKSHVTMMAVRTRPSHQGRGLSVNRNHALREMFRAEYPTVVKEIHSMRVSPGNEKHRRSSTIVNHLNTAGYEVILNDLDQALRTSMPVETVHSLTYLEALDILNSTNIIEDFIGRFCDGYIPADENGRPVRVNKQELRDLFQTNRLCVSFEENKPILNETIKIETASSSDTTASIISSPTSASSLSPTSASPLSPTSASPLSIIPTSSTITISSVATPTNDPSITSLASVSSPRADPTDLSSITNTSTQKLASPALGSVSIRSLSLSSSSSASREEVRVDFRGGKHPLQAFSFCHLFPLQGNIRADFYFYGTDADLLIEHAIDHLKHLKNVCDGSIVIHFTMGFPLALGHLEVAERMVRAGLPADKVITYMDKSSTVVAIKDFI